MLKMYIKMRCVMVTKIWNRIILIAQKMAIKLNPNEVNYTRKYTVVKISNKQEWMINIYNYKNELHAQFIFNSDDFLRLKKFLVYYGKDIYEFCYSSFKRYSNQKMLDQKPFHLWEYWPDAGRKVGKLVCIRVEFSKDLFIYYFFMANGQVKIVSNCPAELLEKYPNEKMIFGVKQINGQCFDFMIDYEQLCEAFFNESQIEFIASEI